MKHALQLARRGSPRLGWIAAAVAAVLTLAMIAAGCGGSNGPGVARSGSTRSVYASAIAYTRCMRSHGVHDFPDPTTSPGGGIGFAIDGGPGSDLNRNNPTFEKAGQACRSLQPGGPQPPAPSSQKISLEVKWARCMRSHGLPSFPDPNSQGAFDSSKFNDSSPAFQTASDACKSMEAAMGAVSAVPGRG